MSECIASTGVGHWYAHGVIRLRDSLEAVGWKGATQLHAGVYPKGCPTHQEVPYGFKLFTIQKARAEGHDQVLWMDASGEAKRNPEKVFEIIHKQGHYFWTSGTNCGRWCNDQCLKYFGLTRERAYEIPMIYALVIGLDFTHPRTRILFDRWQKSLDDGIFNGSWEDHRHDQSCASIIAWELGMGIDHGHTLCHLKEEAMPETVELTFQGM